MKADVGSIGGHLRLSDALLREVKEFVSKKSHSYILSSNVTYTGDDIALLVVHRKGVGNKTIHKLAWDAFVAGTGVAKSEGLYGAGQDLLKDAFSGNVKGMGPAVAEMAIEPRPNEAFVVFAADKTDPGAYNLPLYLGFADPMHCSGLMLSPKIFKGFTFTIMDVSHTEGDRIIKLNTPEEIYDIACLLRDNQRFVIESIHSREDGDIAAAVSTTRLHNIAGTYTGKDDPVAIVRAQGGFPATGEILSPYRIGHFVAGFMRGSHQGPLMPMRMNTPTSFFDGPPTVSAAAYCVSADGKLTEAVDAFDHPFWDHVRDRVAAKAIDIRQQGFSGCAMLHMDELEYGGIVKKMAILDKRFAVRD